MDVTSVENLRVIRGSLYANGDIKAGSGFRVVKEETGIYVVLFDFSFAGRPTVVVTQNYPGNDNISNDGGSTLDNAVVVAVKLDRMKFKTGNGGGNVEDRASEFIVIGPV